MFRNLISLDEATQILRQTITSKPIGSQQVPLSEAWNRILAKNVRAPINVPPFNRSTVDGYAVRAADTFGAEEDRPIALQFYGRVNAGESPTITIKAGKTCEIVTGAPLPQGVNAVVMKEDSTQEGTTIQIRRSVSQGENVMRAGSDIRKGETVLERNKQLSSRDIGVLAALGLTEITVYRRPRVAILSTGAEIIEVGKPLPSGKIFDVNIHSLSAAILECGGEPIQVGIIPDEKRALEEAVKQALDQAEVVITSGGVSVGPKDVMPQVLNSLGKPGVILSGIAVKPGKPTTVAMIGKKPVFSLPGHPTSSLLMFHVMIQPIINKMAGNPKETPTIIKAIATTKMFSARGRQTFIMVKLSRSETRQLLAAPVPTGLSGAITTLAKADGFIKMRKEQQFIQAREVVKVQLFKK